MTTYITQEQAEKLAFGFGGVVPSYRGVEKKDVYPLCNAAIQAYKETLVAGVVLPEPYGYDVYVEEADNGYIVYNLDDPQLVDDATNHDATTTTLYTADQLRQAIADALAKQVPQWLPIDTAPKDGTWILVSGGETDDEEEARGVAVASWTREFNGSVDDRCSRWQFAKYDGGYYGEYINPTHWMPLPAAPDPKEAV